LSARIIDGKAVAAEARERVRQEVAALHAKGVRPGLAAVRVGNNPASEIYVRNKRKACEEAGIYSEEHALPEDTPEGDLLDLVHRLNANSRINGILVQLPLPKQISERVIVQAVSPEKDVDGFHPINVGRLTLGEPTLAPCTPLGIIALLDAVKVGISGSRAVVVGRSNVVGKPISLMLLHRHATVTICHSRTRELPELCRSADILVAAIGKPRLITEQMVKEGAAVVDVGINRLENGKIVGDVDFEGASKRAGWITPVPGGVGPMTIAMLLSNTAAAAKAASKGG
jgi:methylenetetrahydrofolate dehydrogenase (NADP+)/methenyltetrahydrofolate cyclohydrolase